MAKKKEIAGYFSVKDGADANWMLALRLRKRAAKGDENAAKLLAQMEEEQIIYDARPVSERGTGFPSIEEGRITAAYEKEKKEVK